MKHLWNNKSFKDKYLIFCIWFSAVTTLIIMLCQHQDSLINISTYNCILSMCILQYLSATLFGDSNASLISIKWWICWLGSNCISWMRSRIPHMIWLVALSIIAHTMYFYWTVLLILQKQYNIMKNNDNMCM